MKICSAHERASMPGLLDTGEVARLGSTEGSSFDALFLDLMTSQGGGSNGEFAGSRWERPAFAYIGACHPS